MMIAASLFLGVVTWSLLEYSIHRWLGHDKRTRPNFFAKEHTRHHIEGDYFAPPRTKLIPAVIVVGTLCGFSVWVAGPVLGLSYVAGLVGFYLFYEMFHRMHHTHEGRTRYGKWARRHHFNHHFGDARYNHGVTTPIWDFVFGTYRPAKEVIRVPPKLKMRWLTNDTGEVHPHLTTHYQLR